MMLPLRVVQSLADQLHQADIHYCHWKSNEHLDAAVQGKTDLDVLVDHTRKASLKQVLNEVGFKYFEAIPCRRYKDIDDYLAIDAETGTLVHLHLHYQLELGEKQLKGYDIPWAEQILSSRIYNDAHHFYTTEPHIEMILLIVRATLKTRTRDRLKNLIGHDYFKGDFIREFRWLKQKIELDKMERLSQELLGDKASRLVQDILNDESHLKRLLRYDSPIHSALKQYRRYSPLMAARLRWQRESENLFYKVLNRYFDAPVTTRRTPMPGGLIIGVLGADGSGKSTVTTEISKCLSQKLDVLPIYLGSGDGKASWLRSPLIWANRFVKRLRSKQSMSDAVREKVVDRKKEDRPKEKHPKEDRPKEVNSPSTLSSLAQMLWATTLTYEKKSKLNKSEQAKKRGMIVICDRYPQTQFLGFNDGPLLSNGTASAFPPALQQWEIESYQQMVEKTPPDLIIKLNVTPEVALARKPNSPAQGVRKKVTAVQALQFSSDTTVVEIDATQPLQAVLQEAKQAVWKKL